MTARNVTPHTVNAWRGLNTFASRNNIDETSWIDSNNVLVNARGEAEVLRSPKAFGGALTPSGHLVYGMHEFQRSAGNALIVDYYDESFYLLAAAGNPTGVVIISAFDSNVWTTLSINDTLQRINGSTFAQVMADLSSYYSNGLQAPPIEPTISYVVNGLDTTVIATSLQGSYAYYSTVTGHVSPPSPLSNILGPKAAGFDVRFSYTSTLQAAVDKIIFFLTVDGGSVPYLVIDLNGDPIVTANATTTHDIVQSSVTRDTLTPEPIYNLTPPQTATSMFAWKDRIFLIVDGGLRYSGFESCYIGNPYECWPPLNQLNVPNRNDRAIGGISTQAGALVFGEKDSYLLSGYPSDKVVAPDNLIAVTEHMDSQNWNIGIRYIRTAVNTPFGVIWVDQTKRIRLWNLQGVPNEIAQALRTELDNMTGALFARWFQHGKNGGYYILSDGTTVLFLMVYLSPTSGEMQFGYGKSTSIAPEAMATITFNGTERFFFGKTGQVWEMMVPDTAGDGWPNGTLIFFKIVIGNAGKKMNFSNLHSIEISGDMDDLDLAVTQAPMSEVSPETIELTEVLESDTGGTFYGMIDSVERRYHIVNFTFENDDRTHKSIDSLTINVRDSRRLI